MKKTFLASLLIIALAITTTANAQVGIGVSTENIHPSAQLDVSSTTKGFLPPRMTEVQKNAINSPAAGLLVYQTDGVSGYYYFDGAIWKSGLGPQGQVGPAGLSATTTIASSGSLPFFGSSGTFALTPSPNNVYINAGSYISIGINNTSQYFYVSNKLDDNTITIAKTTIDAGFSWPVNATVALVGPLGPNGPKGQAGINGSDATISIGAIGTATTNGASITSGVLSLAPADESNGGIVTNTAQTFAGNKTFNSDLIVNGVTIGTGSGSINNNTAIGNASLAANTTGTYNTAHGINALNNNLTGSTNTANGAYSLYNNTTGYQNTAIGGSSLVSNSTANQNTAIGFGALQSVASGSRNTALGYNADVISTYLSNATAIGAGALVTENNTIQLGDINVNNVVTSGQYTGSGFKTPTGTNTQYLMADGSTSSAMTITSGSFSTVFLTRTVTISYKLITDGTSKIVHLYIPSFNEMFFNISRPLVLLCDSYALPLSIRPSDQQVLPCNVTNNRRAELGFSIIYPDGLIGFFLPNETPWVTTGRIGTWTAQTITYIIN